MRRAAGVHRCPRPPRQQRNACHIHYYFDSLLRLSIKRYKPI